MSNYMLARPPGLAQAGSLADLVCESPVIKFFFFFLLLFQLMDEAVKGRRHSAGR